MMAGPCFRHGTSAAYGLNALGLQVFEACMPEGETTMPTTGTSENCCKRQISENIQHLDRVAKTIQKYSNFSFSIFSPVTLHSDEERIKKNL